MTQLVFDIGGSSLRAGLWVGGELTERAESTSPGVDARSDSDPVGTLVNRLRALKEQLLGDGPPAAIGVGFPGPVRPDGHVCDAPTLWGALEQPVVLADVVAREFDVPRVLLVNDVTAAGYRFAEQPGDFAIVTVSSGIGAKVFLGGDPAIGARGLGGEIGHWCVDDTEDAPLCECGGRGHLGAVASGRATPFHLERLERERPGLFAASVLSQGSTNDEVVSAFQAGDVLGEAIVDRGIRALASALALLRVGVGVERFHVFGGFAVALGAPYRVRLANAIEARSWGGACEVLGVTDDDSGLIGMGRLLDRNGGAR